MLIPLIMGGMETTRLLARAALRSAQFGVVEAGAPWCARVGSMAEGALIYAVLEGGGWLETAGGAPQWFKAGDFILTPRGVEHRMGSGSEAASEVAAIELLSRRPAGRFVVQHGGNGARTEFVAIYAPWDEYSQAVIAPMLPEVVILTKEALGNARHAERAARMLAEEAHAPRTGSVAIVNRLVNLILLELLFALAEGQSQNWLRGGPHPQIARALHLIHTSLTHDWTTIALAKRVGMSRSAFNAHFKEVTGSSPGDYLLTHRLANAARLLSETDADVAAAAEAAGYDSIPSFTKAFKKRYGASPSRYREIEAEGGADFA